MYFSQEIYLKMGKTPVIIHVLRALIALLVILMILVGTAIFLVQRESKKNILDATTVLREKNKPLEILDQCIQKIYNTDNDFRLYTLSFSKEAFEKYKGQLRDLDALTTALEASLSSGPGSKNPAYALQAGTREKEALQASFGRLRRMSDSLLKAANSLQSLTGDAVKPAVTVIKAYQPDLTFISTDTVLTSTEETKKKKGFFSKVKAFFKGETETKKTNKQIAVKTGTQSGTTASLPVTMAAVGMEVARQTNLYYENQLKEQYKLNQQLKEKEKELLELNSRLMGNISSIFRDLKKDYQVREKQIDNLAVANIIKYSRITEYLVLASAALAILFAFLIALTIRKIITYQRGIIAARKKAETEAAEKSKFLAFMSHELRTPLTSIIGFTEQLKETPLQEDQQKYIQAMSGSSDILLTTVNDILDMSKLDSGKFRFVKFTFLVKPVFEQVINSLRHMAQKKGLSVELVQNIPDNLCFLGDEMRLKQVLINLVNNAIKYSEKGTITVTVGAEIHKGKSKLQVEVADQGIGIDADKLPEVFSEFSQVHEQSSKKWIIGTGLGLPICKKIVEQQGGTIRVNSIKGEGSTFSFVIPYQTVMAKQEEAEQKELIFDPSLFKEKNILAADDTEINLVLLDSIFRKWGVTIDKARNGKEALQLFKTKHYHLVLSDVYMPEMDGMELTRQIRNSVRPANKDVPVIILSANMIQDEIEKFKLAGVTDYLPKPFLAADLYKIVARRL